MRGQIFLRYGARRHTHGGFTRRRATAAAVVPHPVFVVIGVVCMGRPEHVLNRAVVFALLVFVTHQQANGRARCDSLENTGQNLYAVTFTALSCVL